MSEKSGLHERKDLLVLGWLAVKDLKRVEDMVTILDRFDYDDASISRICGCAVQTVRNARQNKKRKA